MNKDLIFHYTSTDAFRCLIESVKDSKNKDSFRFYASNILYMNDPDEFVYGRKVFINALKKIENELEINDDQRISSLWSDWSPNGDKKYISNLLERKKIPYAISFSGVEESLPMWLNYGNSGKGVCLAFKDIRYRPFSDSINQSTEFVASEVHYNRIKKKSFLYEIMYDVMKGYKEELSDGYVTKFKDSFFDVLIQYAAPFIKSNSFQHEREIRLSRTIGNDVGEDASEIKFRCNANGNIIPYTIIDINVNLLDYVIIGPFANYELTKMALDMMADRYLDKRLNVIKSRVKYRNY